MNLLTIMPTEQGNDDNYDLLGSFEYYNEDTFNYNFNMITMIVL